jgi:hypothetical protein
MTMAMTGVVRTIWLSGCVSAGILAMEAMDIGPGEAGCISMIRTLTLFVAGLGWRMDLSYMPRIDPFI